MVVVFHQIDRSGDKLVITTDILPGVFVSFVMYGSLVTVGLAQVVVSLDAVSVPALVLRLEVAGVMVLHFVVEFVFRVRLKIDMKFILVKTLSRNNISKIK